MLLLIIYLLVAGIVVAVDALIANAYAKCAAAKGYQRSTYFLVCFFLGMIGYVVVAALPDKVLNDRLNQILSKSK